MNNSRGNLTGLALMENEGDDGYLYVGSEDGKLFQVQFNRSRKDCALQPELRTVERPGQPSKSRVFSGGSPLGGAPNAALVAIAVAVVAVAIIGSLIYEWHRLRAGRERGVLLDEQRPSSIEEGGALDTWGIMPSRVKQLPFRILSECTDKFSEGRRIGEKGAFGKVYRGSLDGKEVAIKVMTGELTDNKRSQFVAEVNTLSGLNHDNLVQLVGWPRGSATFTPPIIHRDVKSSNILLGEGSGEKLHVVVADFGLAAIGERVLGTGHDHIVMTSHIGGTFGYMSPEYMLRGELSEKNDVYSYGVLVLELLTGRKVVTPAPSGLAWQTLVEWVKPFLRGGVVQSGSMEMPYPILDRCLWDQVAGESMKKMVISVFQLACEWVQEEYGSRPAMREIIQRIHNMFLEVGWDGLTVMMVDLENDVDDGAEPPHDVSGEDDCMFRGASSTFPDQTSY
ncbi:hypothetical protein CBR_g20230 [Chara braunii]|uniref:Protein kinase domain-containing protein n=1 Tax=Chara braunii TaxID=69332 RepID=A0A388KZW5_CHABU|nr:hypothetical protein CBR_g20230 [Chara braunii]|eukprot:GBG75599.1 hypothetical protein CBR_g20230 [Chara braunii]